MSINPIIPINLQPIPLNFNSEYVLNLIALGVDDFFIPTNTNPLFENVNNFHQNVGLLQTASSAIEKILTYIDILKTNPPQDVIDTLTNQINEIINNTTFDNLAVFTTLNINDEKLDLNLPVFSIDNIDEYEKLLLSKQEDIFDAIKNLNLTLPFEQNTQIPSNLINAFNYTYLNNLNLLNLLE